MFSPAVIEKLQHYVYFLQDPRNGEVFYIGKGVGNRVFHHVTEALEGAGTTEKLGRIREIEIAGYEVEHFILRHGLSEAMAFEIEAAFIDYAGMGNLSNIMGGHYSSDYGLRSTHDIIQLYQGIPLHTEFPAMLFNINSKYRRDMTAAEIYESTRQAWILGRRREIARFAIAVYGGMTREVYEVRKWFPVKTGNRVRWGFKGRLARDSIRDQLLHKSTRRYFRKGIANPVKYLNC
jgi:hypothetical protein